MSFFNKLENKINSNITQNINNDTIEKIDSNNNFYNISNNVNNNSININNYSRDKALLDNINTNDNIDKFKKYISLINPDHHYFINYSDCYIKASNILNAKDTINVQELRNNIKMSLYKYKNTKNYNFITKNKSIEIFDLKKNKIVDIINLPICINLKDIHNKALKNLNNIYTKTKLAYDLLLNNDDNNDSKLSEFKKLRSSCEHKVNEYYIIQYLLNFLSKHNPNNEHFTTHIISQVYNISKDITRTLLVLGNSHINQNIINNIIELESELLDKYNNIKQQLKNGITTTNKDIKQYIKEYIEKKTYLDNKIKKINDIKTKEHSATIYLSEQQISDINISVLKNYYRSLIGSKPSNNNNYH